MGTIKPVERLSQTQAKLKQRKLTCRKAYTTEWVYSTNVEKLVYFYSATE